MKSVRLLFGACIFLASFLLFLVEPIAAKQLLPVLGGSASVWIACLVFFQTALLLGYLYAHWFAHRAHWVVHVVLLLVGVVASVAWAINSLHAGDQALHPIRTIFEALGVSIGVPFLLLAATSPLLQVWWARILPGGVPYKMYALSNLASLLALAAYPTLIEPHLALHTQRMVWSAGFAVFALLAAVLTWRTRSALADGSTAVAADETAMPVATLREKLLWVLLPMGAAMQLSAVTAYLTANVAAIPLLWILPLGVYLITLILAFEFPRLLPRGILTRFLIVLMAGLAYMLMQVDVTVPLWLAMGFFLAELFFACLFCHSEAYRLHPARSSEATLFYLLFAAGGALGSFLIGIVSPLVFTFNLDLEISFFAVAALALAVTWPSGWSQRLLWSVASVLMLALVVLVYRAYRMDTLVSMRNFYGSLRVRQNHGYPGATLRTLTNGTIQHGTQIFGTDELRKTPTTYYGRDSGIGIALSLDHAGSPRNIGVIGLGAGTLAAYARPGDHVTFYEINPAVEPIARNLFTYIRDSGAQVQVETGDARATLEREAPQNFDVLVVDAFSGDAIPLHLLTTEAVDSYKRNLAPDGILAFHVSNQHVDLGPPIALLAKSAGMQVVKVTSPPNEQKGEFTATWVLLCRDPAVFARAEFADHSSPPHEVAGMRVWTDDYSSLLPVLRW